MSWILAVHGPDAARVLARAEACARALALPPAGFRRAFGTGAIACAPRAEGGELAARASSSATPPGAFAWLGGPVRRGGARFDAAACARAACTGAAPFGADAAGLDGHFALLALDGAGRLLAVTDRVGTQHLYRAEHAGGHVVSTSALLLAALAGRSPERLAVRELLGTGSVFEQRSLFEGVQRVVGGSWLEFGVARAPRADRWWTAVPLYGRATSADPVRELADALVAALDDALATWPDAVLDLTGGFDSRAVLAAALATGRPLRTVVAGPDGHGDVRAAARIARVFGLDHRQLRPGLDYGARDVAELHEALLLTDGECDVLEYAGIAAIQRGQRQRAGAAGATVNGTAGEFARGYWWDLLDAQGRLDPARAARGRFATDPQADARVPCGEGPPLERHFTDVARRTLAPLAALPGTVQADQLYLDLRMARWAGRLASATGRIWPCVSPFLFEGPLRAALAVDPALRRGDRLARRLIERLSPRLASLPMANGAPALPLRAATLPRFAPLALELSGKVVRRVLRRRRAAPAPWRWAQLARDPAADELTRPEALLSAGWHAPEALARLLAEARAGRADETRLGRVLALELATRALRDARA